MHNKGTFGIGRNQSTNFIYDSYGLGDFKGDIVNAVFQFSVAVKETPRNLVVSTRLISIPSIDSLKFTVRIS